MKKIRYVLSLALSWAAVAGRAEMESPVRDDPRGRQAARALEQGVRTPDDRLQILMIARAEAPCWLQIPSAREGSGAPLVKRHAGSRDGGHRVRGLQGRTPLSREVVVVESAAGDRGLGADALRCKSGRTR